MTNITKAAQDALMKFDPANGGARPYPSDAYQWRQFHGPAMAWMFNPWTGTQRTTGDVGSDPQGLLICPPGGQLYAETRMPEARSISDEMMDCVDRLGSEFDSVDPRVWGHLLVYAPDDKVLARARATLAQPAPSPQAPGRRKGPPGITLEPQGHEPLAAPVDEQAEFEAWDRQIRKTVEAVQDPDTVPAFHNGYYTLTPGELRRVVLAFRLASYSKDLNVVSTL